MPRRKILAFTVLAAVVALLAMYLGWRFSAPAASPIEPEAAAPAPAAAGPLTFDELAALLSARKDRPGAAELARSFAAKPRLMRLYNRFLDQTAQSRARRQAGPTAERFLRELKREPDFGGVAALAARDPAMRALAEEVARQPGVGAAARAAGASSRGADAPGPAALPRQRVFGLSGPPPSEASGGMAGAGAPALASPGERRASDPRPEGHWIHDGGPMDLLSICGMLASTSDCRRVIEDCRKDERCSRRFAAAEGAAGPGVSTATAKPPDAKPTPAGHP